MLAKKNNLKRKKIIAEINVTPFVDVLLVILIIFMVTSPMLDNGFSVKLPESGKNSIQNINNKQLTLAIDEGANVYFDDKKTPTKNLYKDLSKLNAKEFHVFIKADKNVKYQEVVSLMSTLNKLGFLSISLVTEVQ